jgi:hypothetical protein
MIEITDQTMKDISAWMAENPVINSESSKEAKLFLDRGKLAIQDMEDERKKRVGPLNDEVKEINNSYRPVAARISKVVDTLSDRLTAFIKEERRIREEANRVAAGLAREAEIKAREAERLEREAIESANHGELGVDVAAHVADADIAFRDFEKSQRAAALTEKETHVKITGGFSRAVSLKTKETLVVVDAQAALQEMGANDEIKEAILKLAREYRRATGDLPPGVEASYREEI